MPRLTSCNCKSKPYRSLDELLIDTLSTGPRNCYCSNKTFICLLFSTLPLNQTGTPNWVSFHYKQTKEPAAAWVPDMHGWWLFYFLDFVMWLSYRNITIGSFYMEEPPTKLTPTCTDPEWIYTWFPLMGVFPCLIMSTADEDFELSTTWSKMKLNYPDGKEKLSLLPR